MAIVTAKLVKRITDDRMVQIEDHVPLGKVYRVDLATRRWTYMVNTVHNVQHKKEIVNEYPSGMYLPCELLEFGGAPE